MAAWLLILSLLPVAGIRAEPEDASARLKRLADGLRSGEEDLLIFDKSDDGRWVKPRRIPRQAALRGAYEELAAVEVRQAMESRRTEASRREFEPVLKSLEARSRQAAQDAEAVELRPEDVIETGGCGGSCCVERNIYGVVRCDCFCRAGRGMAAGRRPRTPLDDELDWFESSLAEATRRYPGDNRGRGRGRWVPTSAKIYEGMAEAVEASRTGATSLRRSLGAVVFIIATGKDGSGELGAGIVVDRKGRILTSARVVGPDESKLYDQVGIYLRPEKPTGNPKEDMTRGFSARVVRRDPVMDLALLEPEKALEGVEPAVFGDSSKVEKGDPVATVGHPETGGLWKLSRVTVVAPLADMGATAGRAGLRLDKALERGSAGGPLLDIHGRLLGIRVHPARGGADEGFAVQTATIRKWLDAGEPPVDYAVPEEAPPPAPLVPEPQSPVADVPAPETQVRAAPQAPPEAPAVPPVEKPAVKRAKPAKKVYRADDLIKSAMGEMDDMEKEMRREIESRRAGPGIGD